MKRLLLVVCLLSVPPGLAAASPKDSLGMRHQVRVGWGDMLFETMAFHASPTHLYANPQALPENFRLHESFDYGYTGHFFAQYQYRASRVVRVGGMLDVEGIFWKEGYFDRNHQLVGKATAVRNYNLVVMPTVRFDYFRRPVVSLYSGLGTGLLLALDNAGGSALSPALNLNLIGIQLGRGHWSGSVELGAMIALSGAYKIYMVGSRLLSFSLNYSW